MHRVRQLLFREIASQCFLISNHRICSFRFVEEKILSDIRGEFDAQQIEYICVARELSAKGRQHLHMQIILKKPVNKFGWFMDKHTGV